MLVASTGCFGGDSVDTAQCSGSYEQGGRHIGYEFWCLGDFTAHDVTISLEAANGPTAPAPRIRSFESPVSVDPDEAGEAQLECSVLGGLRDSLECSRAPDGGDLKLGDQVLVEGRFTLEQPVCVEPFILGVAVEGLAADAALRPVITHLVPLGSCTYVRN